MSWWTPEPCQHGTARGGITTSLQQPPGQPLAGFLAGYAGNTRISYTTDLRLFADWCAGQPTCAARGASGPSGDVRPPDGAGGPDALHGGPPAVDAGQLLPLLPRRRLLERNPAANVRRPKVDHESRTLGLDRNELGALLVQAGLGSPRDHALISLLAMNGLRISEALGADIDDLDMDRGHRTLRIVRKGGKHVTIPLAPRTGSGARPVHR